METRWRGGETYPHTFVSPLVQAQIVLFAIVGLHPLPSPRLKIFRRPCLQPTSSGPRIQSPHLAPSVRSAKAERQFRMNSSGSFNVRDHQNVIPFAETSPCMRSHLRRKVGTSLYISSGSRRVALIEWLVELLLRWTQLLDAADSQTKPRRELLRWEANRCCVRGGTAGKAIIASNKLNTTLGTATNETQAPRHQR